MQISTAQVFQGSTAYDINLPAEWATLPTGPVDTEAFAYWLCGRVSSFMAMGRQETMRRLKHKVCEPMVVDGKQLAPAMTVVWGNGFNFTWRH